VRSPLETGSIQVDLRVLAFNDGAIASYRACGFVEEGREPDCCWCDGQCYADIIMGFWPPSSQSGLTRSRRAAGATWRVGRQIPAPSGSVVVS
jgi:RimJ/RimL family protein N-acetyltransferase